MLDHEHILKISRNYTTDEVVKFLRQELKNSRVKIGALKSELDHFNHNTQDIIQSANQKAYEEVLMPYKSKGWVKRELGKEHCRMLLQEIKALKARLEPEVTDKVTKLIKENERFLIKNARLQLKLKEYEQQKV